MKKVKNKKLLKAIEFHKNWLEERGLSSNQLSARLSNAKPINKLPSLKVEGPKAPSGRGYDKTPGKRTMMELRFKESPEVRAEIERKALRIGQTVNKSNYGYVTDGDLTKYEGRVRK